VRAEELKVEGSEPGALGFGILVESGTGGGLGEGEEDGAR